MRTHAKLSGVLSCAAAIALGCSTGAKREQQRSLATSSPEAQREPVLQCAFKAGERIALTMRSRAKLDGSMSALSQTAPDGVRDVREQSSVDIELEVVEATPGTPALVHIARRAQNGAWARALLRVESTCRFADVGFAPKLDESVRRQFENELRVLEVVGPETASADWSTEQTLPHGKVRTAYRITEKRGAMTTIERRVARVLGGDAASSIREAGRTRAWVVPGQAWIERLELDRQLVLASDAATLQSAQAMARETVTVERRAEHAHGPAPLAAGDVRWSRQRLKPHRGHNRTYRSDSAPPGLAEMPGEDLVKALVAGLAAREAAPLLSARKHVVYALRQRPELASSLAKAALAGATSEEGTAALVLALTDAGNPQSEEALVSIAESPDASPGLRHLATFQMHRHITPSQTTVDALRRATSNPDLHRRTRHAGWAALGALVGLGRLPLALEDSVRSDLAKTLASTTDKGLLLTLLSAAGNSRHAELADNIEQFLGKSHDPTLRVHAMVVLERMGVARSASETLSLMEELHDVRHLDRLGRLLRYGDLPIDGHDLAAAQSRLQPGTDRLQREAAVHVLGRRAQLPKVRGFLASWYAQESDAQIKQEIGRYVPARQLRAARKPFLEQSRELL